MSWAEHTRSLIAYNEWANDKVLEAAAGLSEEELGRQVSGSHESVRMTLLHVAQVQTWWLSVLNGKPERPSLPEGHGLMPLEDVRQWFTRSHGDLKAYAAGLTDERLAAEVSAFHPGEKKEYRWPSWQLLSHLVNHSAHTGRRRGSCWRRWAIRRGTWTTYTSWGSEGSGQRLVPPHVLHHLYDALEVLQAHVRGRGVVGGEDVAATLH